MQSSNQFDALFKSLVRHFEDKGHWWTFAKKREVRRWTLTLITGLFCGLVAIFVTFFTRIFTRFKFSVFYSLLEKERNGEVTHGIAFVFYLACNFVYIFMAWLTVWAEPLAGGSGKILFEIFIYFVVQNSLSIYYVSCKYNYFYNRNS